MKRNLKKTQRIGKYFKYASDSRVVRGVPELILHPLKKRPEKDLVTTDNIDLENNYEQIGSFLRTDISRMEKFMDKHAEYNPNSYFFTYR
jgi:hypothetical protein